MSLLDLATTALEGDDDFNDAQDDAVFGVDTDVSDLLAM
jgi:hypothetical protein